MPTYEYACTACGHAWEEVQRITEPPLDLCPSCKQSSAHRLISGGTNFILKGGGWYSDLYASPKPAAKADSATTPSASEPGKSAPSNGASSEAAKPSPSTAATGSAPPSSSSPSPS
ncbi:MAG TPA: zinc ribbon domain-containing protein [Polyangiaceae bacterium]|nr:zinc ribbon domain-containing protein [Polyangiaceae bacterium]